MPKPILIAALVAMVSACVVYPTTHTYYVPNPADGSPVESQSCGHLRTGKDSLERLESGMTVTVTPRLVAGEPVSAMVVFRYGSGELNVNGGLVRLRIGASVFSPTKFETKLFPAHTTHGSDHHQWLHLTFPESVGAPDEISITFNSGALRKDGAELDVAPFRFTRATRKDLYVASINC